MQPFADKTKGNGESRASPPCLYATDGFGIGWTQAESVLARADRRCRSRQRLREGLIVGLPIRGRLRPRLPASNRRIREFGKSPKLTILDANLTAVEMLFSCFVLRQTRVAQRAKTPSFRGWASNAAACYTCSPPIIQAVGLANVLETVEGRFERRREGGFSWRKCHMTFENGSASSDSNLPSERNPYKQSRTLLSGEFCHGARDGTLLGDAGRLIRTESLD